MHIVFTTHLPGLAALPRQEDEKCSYATNRLIGMSCSIRCSCAGLLTAPGSPRYALARNLRETPSSLCLRHVQLGIFGRGAKG
jgi:hypothetical protein